MCRYDDRGDDMVPQVPEIVTWWWWWWCYQQTPLQMMPSGQATVVPPAPPLSVMNTSERYLPLKSSWFQVDCCWSLYGNRRRMFVVRAIGPNHLRPNRSNMGSDSGSIDDDLLEVIHVDDGQLWRANQLTKIFHFQDFPGDIILFFSSKTVHGTIISYNCHYL